MVHVKQYLQCMTFEPRTTNFSMCLAVHIQHILHATHASLVSAREPGCLESTSSVRANAGPFIYIGGASQTHVARLCN